jgi:hypothetical protein
MAWEKILRAESSRPPPRLTMSMGVSGRNKARVVRFTMRGAPEWLLTGKVDLLLGHEADEGRVRIEPGSEHAPLLMPTPGKVPTGMVRLVMGKWPSMPFSYQEPTEVLFTTDGDALIVELPEWADPDYRPSLIELKPPQRVKGGKAKVKALPPVVMSWSEAKAEAELDSFPLTDRTVLSVWNDDRMKRGQARVQIAGMAA